MATDYSKKSSWYQIPEITKDVDTFYIYPLNWKRDETYAPASENLGSYMPNLEAMRYEIKDIGADAQVVLSRGVILTNAKYDYPADPGFFGPQSYHEDDYTFYYNNLKANVAKRVAAYKSEK